MQLFFCPWGVSLTNRGVFPDEVEYEKREVRSEK